MESNLNIQDEKRYQRFRHLLKSYNTKVAHIEFTSRCNLRCVFCMASQPEYNGKDLDFSTIDDLIKVLKKRKIKVVSVNGHGETSIFPNWYKYCNKMLELGIDLHIISNFAKTFSKEELITLSKFKDIEISCDSSNPELFAQLRRGADLKTLILNIAKVRAAALVENRQPPSMSFSCVVSDKNVMQLKELVSFGIGLEIKYFNFCNLTRYPDVEGAIQVNHVSEMPFDFVKKAHQILNDTFKFLKNSKIKYNIQQGLLDTIQQKLAEPEKDLQEEIKEEHEEHESIDTHVIETHTENPSESDDGGVPVHRYAVEKKIKQTRNCLDPWHFVLVTASQDVLPCCWHEPLYSLSNKQSLSDVFNNRAFQELRMQLLTGDLSSDCANCPTRGLISLKKFRRKVLMNLLNNNYKMVLKTRLKRDSRTKHLQVKYDNGWYPEEVNANATDPMLKKWRWTEKKATCFLENTPGDTTLILYGSVDKSKFTDQNITLRLNGEMLDEFLPREALFFKEYKINQSGNFEENQLILEIESNKTFRPSAIDKTSSDNRDLGIQIFRLFWNHI